MKFFEVRMIVQARETEPMSGCTNAFRDCELVVTVHMGDSATPDDAVKELARRLGEVCNDAPPYSGG
jgi:hypothetical protein